MDQVGPGVHVLEFVQPLFRHRVDHAVVVEVEIVCGLRRHDGARAEPHQLDGDTIQPWLIRIAPAVAIHIVEFLPADAARRPDLVVQNGSHSLGIAERRAIQVAQNDREGFIILEDRIAEYRNGQRLAHVTRIEGERL